MNILYVVATFSIIEPLGILQLSAITKSLGHNSFVCAIDEHTIDEKIETNHIDIIALSIMSIETPAFYQLSHHLKGKYPRITIIAGGPHPTYFPQMIDYWPIDAIAIGEGDYVIADFVNTLSEGKDISTIPNIHTKQHKNEVRPLVSYLDDLPCPDRTLVDHVAPYKFIGMKSFMATRGCMFQCAYCFHSAYKEIYKNKGEILRRRSVEHLIREIEDVTARYDINFLRFGDDAFVTKYDDWVEEFVEKYQKRVGIPFYFLIHPTVVTKELVYALKQAGCHSIMIGIETGNEHIRKNVLKRNISNEQMIEAFRVLKDHDIKIFSNTMMGIPDTHLEDDLESLHFTFTCSPYYAGFTVFTPFPGTKLYTYSLDQGYLEKTISFESSFSHGVHQSSCLTFVSERQKEIHTNIVHLAAVANKFPFLRGLIVNRLIYWKPNGIFVVVAFLVRNYLNMKVWPFKKTPYTFFRIFLTVLKIDKRNFGFGRGKKAPNEEEIKTSDRIAV